MSSCTPVLNERKFWRAHVLQFFVALHPRDPLPRHGFSYLVFPSSTRDNRLPPGDFFTGRHFHPRHAVLLPLFPFRMCACVRVCLHGRAERGQNADNYCAAWKRLDSVAFGEIRLGYAAVCFHIYLGGTENFWVVAEESKRREISENRWERKV